MHRRALIALLAALPAAARAQDEPPLAFLQGLYEPYRKPDFKGQPYWEAHRFFVADLAHAIQRDFEQARKRNEVPTLDGDPFVDAQDWDIDKLAISVKAEGPKAVGLVSFENQGKPTEITLDLVRTGIGWRISDIKSPSGTLSELYKK